jgi:hypothetical protein
MYRNSVDGRSWYSNLLRSGWSGDKSQWGRFSTPIPTSPGAHPASYTVGTTSFPGGGGVAVVWHWPPTPPNAEDEGTAKLYLYSPSGPLWSVLGWTLPLPLQYIWRKELLFHLAIITRPRMWRGVGKTCKIIQWNGLDRDECLVPVCISMGIKESMDSICLPDSMAHAGKTDKNRPKKIKKTASNCSNEHVVFINN